MGSILVALEAAKYPKGRPALATGKLFAVVDGLGVILQLDRLGKHLVTLITRVLNAQVHRVAMLNRVLF